MKVNGRDEAAPARPAPDKGRFQQALQKTGQGKKPGRPGALPPAPGAQRPGSPSAPARVAPEALPTRALPTATQVAAGPVRLFAGGSFASTEHLGQVRQQFQVEAHRLREVRSETHQVSQERGEQRMSELISRELARELCAEPAPRPAPVPPGPEPAATPSPLEATSAMEETRAGGPGKAPPEVGDTKSPEARLQAALELVERIEVFVKSQRPALSLRLGGALDATVEVERTGAREVALRIQGHRGPVPAGELARIREALEARGLRLRTLLAS